MLEIINKTGGNLPLLEIIKNGREIRIGAAPVIKHQKKDGLIVATKIENKKLEEKYLQLIEGRFANPVIRLYLETGKLVIRKDGSVEEKTVTKGKEKVVIKKEIPGIDIMEGMYFEKTEKNGIVKWSLEKLVDEEEEARLKEEAKMQKLNDKKERGESLTAKEEKTLEKYLVENKGE